MKARDEGLLSQIEGDVLSDRPLADALRKCIMLGGRAGSADLRDWASRELKGYASEDEVPSYRTVAAPILADAVVGNTIITGQRLSIRDLPEFTHDSVEEAFTFRNGVGEIEAMCDRAAQGEGGLKLSLPMAADLGRLMDQGSGNPWQHTNALYWSISPVVLRGLLDQVRTILTELIAEMRAGMSADAVVPSAALADQAVSVAVYGKRARVSVAAAQASTGGSSAVSPQTPPDSPFWTRSRKIGAFVAGAASVIGLGIAIAQTQGWI